jgi:ADP-dependent NAD(P)H-hydrate dehydratase
MLPKPPADLPRLPPRPRDSSKYDYGRVVVVGGCPGMAGAPALAAMAALRAGAGLVELVVPATVVAIAAGFDPCVMTHGLPAGEDGMFAPGVVDALLPLLGRADAIAVGPGIGRSAAVRDLVLALWREAVVPAVFDADALGALATAPDRLTVHAGPRVLTPHAGEMQRLLGHDPADRAADRGFLERSAIEIAAALDAVVVLKGPATLVAGGARQFHNDTGNPGMATAGTGDVLTGMTAAIVARGMQPVDAARLAVWVHGRAGDAAAADLGQVSMTARDLLDRLHVGFAAASAA